MFIHLRELERDPVEFAESFRPGHIDLGKDTALVENIEASGSAELVDSEIHVDGHLRTAVEVTCARCLDPVRLPVEKDFDLYYRPAQSIAKEEDIQLNEEEMELGFYHGEGLQLEDVLKEQILLSLPMKSLCQADCAGLCPQCGKNRNLGECSCPPQAGDDRWAPLAGLQK